MKEIDVLEATRNIRALLSAAENGEAILITRQGRPIAQISPAGVPIKSEDGTPAPPKFRSRGWRSH